MKICSTSLVATYIHFINKLDEVKQCKQKKVSLWPLRDILDFLNGTGEREVNQCETSDELFAEKLTFSMLYKFIRGHKEYVFHKNASHYICL